MPAVGPRGLIIVADDPGWPDTFRDFRPGRHRRTSIHRRCWIRC
jgi:hypothetical protein